MHFKSKNFILNHKKSPIAVFALGIFIFFAFLFNFSYAQQEADKKKQLREELAKIQDQIKNLENKIYEVRNEKKTLQNQLHILDHEIEKQILDQKALTLSLQEIEEDITFKNIEIIELNEELLQKKELLKEAIKKINSYDKIGWLELIVQGKTLSDVFGQVQNIFSLQKQVNIFIENIGVLRGKLENERSILEERKLENIRLKSLSKLQQESLERKKREKRDLLRKSQGKEYLYQKQIKKSKKDIELIKQQLYKLESVGVSMSFEEAYKKAKFVGEKTGVRPAFILGLFQVESRMGTYIGGGNWREDLYQCYISLGKRTRAEREKKAFLEITSSLGLNPDVMPVSKALRSVGCGGAMGAAQFMPTTWLAYKDKIAELTGNNPPSPWNIEDAFMASAIKLANNGANKKTRYAEKKAAAMYYAGSRWRRYPGQNYARQVLGWADYYQEQINALESGSVAVKF